MFKHPNKAINNYSELVVIVYFSSTLFGWFDF